MAPLCQARKGRRPKRAYVPPVTWPVILRPEASWVASVQVSDPVSVRRGPGPGHVSGVTSAQFRAMTEGFIPDLGLYGSDTQRVEAT